MNVMVAEIKLNEINSSPYSRQFLTTNKQKPHVGLISFTVKKKIQTPKTKNRSPSF